MGLTAAIQRQSRRSYRLSQLSLFGAITASGAILLSDHTAAPVTMSALLSMTAIAGSMFTLHHARRGIYQRLQEAGSAEAERQRLLQSDAVTGAMTRRHFLETLEIALKRATKTPTSLLLIDIDYFKQLNDSLGHAAGDAALVHTVACLRQAFPDCAVGRLGGDEFAVFVNDRSLAWCEEQARKFLALISRPFRYSGFDISLSVSVGAASSVDRQLDMAGLSQNADLALYASKTSGRGRVTLFDEVMLSERRHVRYLERELRAALYLDHLELHYQPVVDTHGVARAMEGLVRWRHPVRGLIPPGEFIPVAETSTLIDQLGEWVFRRACRDLPRFDGCRISINISGEQLKRDSVVAMMERVLRETGSAAADFVIEITETVATEATDDVVNRLDRLRALGFRIALDDFGTGHCGFNYLKTLPIDAIKIDRSYICNLGSDRVAQVLVSALAEVGRLRGITIVAEGVETAQDLQLAKAAGCDRFQGFFISRPVPLAAAAATLPAAKGDPQALSA
ncbi:putative bifunctional diguanylate cyclase/phosphodiesterase [Pararhizobium haloflavum]|uniref:putative bifunctional diguanylate cyclase/phosphodiesterase n=1 Tax=Pararhizobium haloflavum TaxID=2037914 RepID=UPI000C19E1E6|nr:bifunctional diguanylate cyclase/phosphodiesterase [Pararhizobium haloflavum]